ncbi:hypothetical protein [Levilactobacillus cerevisiae]|uniref:hypothetical protein n=1 Tax=Levilactobacillus cerevisiae TaxID=1704076 RepID=UPI000F76E35E|nr:hypothetical protein [Levilactobacillus cerevisiae]
MEPTIRGLHTTQTVVTHPAQWQVLLVLSRGPQGVIGLWRQTCGQHWWCVCRGLWQLQRHQFVTFHWRQRQWQLTPTGETLRPILNAIQTCTANQKGGKTHDL